MLTLIIIVLFSWQFADRAATEALARITIITARSLDLRWVTREALMVLCAAALLTTALADTEVLAAHLAMVQDGK